MSSVSLPQPRHSRSLVVGASVAAAALATTAGWVARRARVAEQNHAPRGVFVEAAGVRIHALQRGHGIPVVLLHGNVVHAEDFVASGLVDQLARDHHVIAPDRPGFGYSERPRDRLWTARTQAAVLQIALQQLNVEPFVLVAHSWATLVALELALLVPEKIRRLVLLSGYYFPTLRLDVAVAAPPALPVVGDVMRYTISALAARATLNSTIKAMFAPQTVPRQFLPVLGREMLLRPSQLKANAEDAAYMIPSAAALRNRYPTVEAPTVIFAGAADTIARPDRHACELHGVMPNSQLRVLPGSGHMVHYSAREQVLEAIRA